MFFFSLILSTTFIRHIYPDMSLALTWRSGLCFHKGTTNKLPRVILYLDYLYNKSLTWNIISKLSTNRSLSTYLGEGIVELPNVNAPYVSQ